MRITRKTNGVGSQFENIYYATAKIQAIEIRLHYISQYVEVI